MTTEQVCNHPYLLDDDYDLGDENLVRACGKFEVFSLLLSPPPLPIACLCIYALLAPSPEHLVHYRAKH